MRPLEDVVVLELGQYVSAPYCALMLADQGAQVIKVERPKGGDPRRDYVPRIEGETESLSGGFLSYNRNKKSVALDLTTETGREAYLRLATKADVVIENLRPGAVDRLGIGPQALHEVNPRLVYCAISGYGRSASESGPYFDRPAFDTAIQAMGGIMAVTGEPDGSPVTTVTAFADIFTAVHAAFGIMTALHARDRNGQGALVDQGMYDSVASIMERELMLWDFTGRPRRVGVDEFAPLGSFRTSDGHVALIIPTDEMWRRLLSAIDRMDLLESAGLSTMHDRALNFGTLLRAQVEPWTSVRTREEVVAAFSLAGLPAGAVQTVDEIYQCRHLEARRMFLSIADPLGDEHRMIRTPARIFPYDLPRNDSSPQLGAHTRDVLVNVAGIPADDVDRWIAQGAL